MSYSPFGERLPGTPQEDLDALFPTLLPLLMYSVEHDDYLPVAEPEKSEQYDPQPPPGWADGIDFDKPFLHFGGDTLLPLVFIDPGKLALSRRVHFTGWGGGQTIPVGVHMRTLVNNPVLVTLAKGLKPFMTSDLNSYLRLEINWMNILREECLIFCLNGPEMSITGGPGSPAMLACIARRIAKAYLKLITDHSAAPKDADPALSHIHFSQLYLASLYTYDSQTYHADVRVVYPYTPPADVEEAIATGMPIL